MYEKDPRSEWQPLMRQMPDELQDLTPYELEHAKVVAKMAAEAAVSPRMGM